MLAWVAFTSPLARGGPRYFWSGRSGTAAPGQVYSHRPVRSLCFLVVRIGARAPPMERARVSSRPDQMRTSTAGRPHRMHARDRSEERRDDDRLETGRKPPFHRRHLVSRMEKNFLYAS